MDYTVNINPDVEGDRNRGWQVDEIVLRTEMGKEIGYMKLAYIPFKRFKSHYPNILYFLSKIKGWGGFDRFYEEGDWKSIAIRSHLHNIAIGDSDIEDRQLSKEEWEYKGRMVMEQLEERYMWQMKHFQQYFVDRPLVDYARVNKEFQRQGYYLKLYSEALKYCESKHMPLYTSGLKSDEAKKAFKKYRKEHKIMGHTTFYNVYYGNDPTKELERFEVILVNE